MTTKRDEMNALMDSMRSDETTAMQDAADLFRSEDMKGFVAQITAFRDQTIPGGPYDQIFTSVLSVMKSTSDLLDNKFPPANEATIEAPAQDGPE